MVVLIDTNILLDVLEKRRGFYGMSLEILTWCASGRIKGGYCPAFCFQYIFHFTETMPCPGTAEAAVRDFGFPAGGWT